MDSESVMKQVIRECDEGERLAPGAYTMKEHIRDLQKLREMDGIELSSLRAQLATAQAELARVTAERDRWKANHDTQLKIKRNLHEMYTAVVHARDTLLERERDKALSSHPTPEGKP